ncbi:MAG: hypothetical protein P1P77_08020 [Spirochaetaceae bacterium]|nr:hypothetical protein [Spirochaetaceae bacterium]
MDKIGKAAESVVKKTNSFMANKKIWAFWALYIVLSGVLFGLLYGILRLAAQRWWIAPIIVIGTGLMWGTAKYSVMKAALQSDFDERTPGKEV